MTDSDYCITNCDYKDAPGWTRFRAESSRITDSYRAAERKGSRLWQGRRAALRTAPCLGRLWSDCVAFDSGADTRLCRQVRSTCRAALDMR